MLFEDLMRMVRMQARLRIHRGEHTERGLALLAGISQSHMHNVLKGARILTPFVADQILRALRLSVLDLLEDESGALSLPARPPIKALSRETRQGASEKRVQAEER